jgi:hypothetical protein
VQVYLVQHGEAKPEEVTDAMAAYGRATELDPKLSVPRLVLAQQAVNSYVPQPERARAKVSSAWALCSNARTWKSFDDVSFARS